MIESLPHKELTAIELKYLGHSHLEISERITTPISTIEGWFRSDGKLFTPYSEYRETMNNKRLKEQQDRISVSDEEFFVLTTNIVRHIGQSLQPRKVPLVNKDGNAIADENGKPQFVEIPPETKFSVKDLRIAWQMQRLMKGLPINYEKQDIEQVNFEADVIIKELGLSPEDFNDDRIEETTKRITEHLLNK